MNALPQPEGLLVLPHLRVQNANAISSPLTHGFPSMTALLGLTWALARRLAPHGLPLALESVGAICHDFQEQTTEGGFTKSFCLTRNPVDKDGSTAAIVEEGRIHLDLTLVFGVCGGFVELDEAGLQAIADEVGATLATMRVAGGSILPPLRPGSFHRPRLVRLGDDPEGARNTFRHLRRRWLPGFALVSRDDLLASRLAVLRTGDQPAATALDAWLDLSRFNWAPVREPAQPDGKLNWAHDHPEGSGWIVPIPVGYAALASPLLPGTVANARDPGVPFQFVESIYSVGEWVAPHRLGSPGELLWYARTDPDTGTYRACNDYAALHASTN